VPAPRRKPPPSGRDPVAWAVGAGAAIASVIGYIVTVRAHGVLLYVDSISHLEIARRVLLSTSPGLAQLGYVWLPLPHLLMLPLIWINPLYQNGFAGADVSMAAYVAATVLIYKITFRLAGHKAAGVAAAGVFALNVNMLYMQSTPMTEALLFCMLAAMVYGVQQWADTGRYGYLVAAGLAALFGTLTRYESWPVLACLLLAAGVIAWQRAGLELAAGAAPRSGRSGGPGGRPPRLARTLRRRAAADRVTVFAVLAFAGIAGWVIWNWAIFGNPLNFQDGSYAKPSNWVSRGEPAIGHWAVAAKTYWFAMADNETWPVLLLAAAGLVVLLAREWRRASTAARTLPVLSLLVVPPFFIASLYAGQRPLHVLQFSRDLYNVRFGLIMAVPAAILAGYLAGLLRWGWARYVAAGLVLALAAGLGARLIRQHDVVTYTAAQETLSSVPVLKQDPVLAYLRGHYTGGRVLMESFGNESIAFQLPSSELVYEGSYRQWQPALRDPAARHITWIIERCGHYPSPDKVCRALGPAQLGRYRAVYVSPGGDYRVYRLAA